MTTTAAASASPSRLAGGRAAVVCVCGLHGGAGTTTTAVLLAHAAAAHSHPGDILLSEADPHGGGLALHLGARSPDSLHTLATDPHGAHPWTDCHGARLIAPAPSIAAPASHAQLAGAVDELAAIHRLIVLDAGPIASPHAQHALEHADLVLWSIDATTQPVAAAHTLASPLTRAARRAPWALVAHATGRDGLTPPATQIAALLPGLRGLALVPRMVARSPGDPGRAHAARDLLELLQ